MGLFKKYTAILFLVLSMVVFSANVRASDINTIPEVCSGLIELGKKIAEDNTAAFDGSSTMRDFVHCNLELLPDGLTTEIMYALFGDNIFPPLEKVSDFIRFIYTSGDQLKVNEVDTIALKSKLESKIVPNPILLAVLEAITFASFQLISFCLAGFSIYYLVNSMKDGDFMGKSINTFWSFAKIIVIIPLIYPLSGLGLNGIQMFIIFIAFCGSLLASFIWSILPMFKYSYLNGFDNISPDLLIEKDATMIDMSEDLVISSLCDVTSRQSLLLKQEKVENFTEEMLSDSEMFVCLKNTKSESDFGNFRFTNELLPFEHKKTIACANKTGTEHKVDCGSFKISEIITEESRDKLVNEVFPFARNMAIRTIGNTCLNNEELSNSEISNYYTYCSNLDSIKFETDYKMQIAPYEEKKILSLIKKEKYTTEDYSKDLFTLKSMIESVFTDELKTYFLYGKEDDDDSSYADKLGFSLKKGWFNAGTFLFDVGTSANVRDDNYKKVLEAFGFSLTLPNDFNEGKKVTVNNSGQVNISETYRKNVIAYNDYVVKGSVDPNIGLKPISTIFSINRDVNTLNLDDEYINYKQIKKDYLKDLTIEEIEDSGNIEVSNTQKDLSWFNRYLYPILVIGKEFNEPNINSDGAKCYENYDNCPIMPINPLTSLIEASRTAVGNTGMVLSMMSITSMIFSRLDNSSSKDISKGVGVLRVATLILDFMMMFLTINMILAILGGYLLPILIFIYFVGNALTWIVTVILSVAGAPLWLGLHLMPSKDEAFAGHAKKGYLLLLDILLKPVFLVLGVFGAFILTTVMLVIFNVTFEIVMTTFDYFDAPNSPIQFFYNFLLNLIYVIFLLLIFFRCAKSVYKIPNSLQNWIGLMMYEEASMWKEVTGLIQNAFMNGVQRYLIFS